MYNLPFNYEELNIASSTYTPTTLKSRNNKAFKFWQRALFQRACSVIEFDFPENWEGSVRDFFYYCLFAGGFVAVFNHESYGVTFQWGALKGFDWYYQPTEVLVTNPALKKTLNLKIHKDCEILKLTPDYCGIFDIIDYYAEKLSGLDNSLNSSIVNSKLSQIFGAKNKAGAKIIEKLLDKINQGEPAVIYDSSIPQDRSDDESHDPWSYWERDVKKNYITTDILNDVATLLNNFDAEIGIPTIPYQKKERLVTDEANSKVMDSTSRSVVWEDTLKSCNKLIEKTVGINLNPRLRYDPDELVKGGGVENGERKDNTL